jgi:hypothetical protein
MSIPVVRASINLDLFFGSMQYYLRSFGGKVIYGFKDFGLCSGYTIIP